MENLIIFRIFLAFPLIGLLIPDTGLFLSDAKNHLSANHTIIELTLLTSIITCSVGISYFKRKINKDINNDSLISV
ncbi:hypothetical protein SAMN05216490_0677 [Mucilaginibacter mallensis]|uniref:Uncharacterized protein n=1 Tax=Mucilaginibacter mallensis TaxID=652787 RepID=A0A1H1Q2Y2_MUCMA|nr:hypothetical protein SAMN05216490_0677 [Mucilaginibacter mallensis]